MDSSWTMLDNAETTWFHWTAAILGSFIVGLSGLVPLLINNPNKSSASSDTSKSKSLNRQLSFAVGGLLGNVFLHLIPEAYGSAKSQASYVNIGLWLIFGIIAFLFIEKIFDHTSDPNKTTKESKKIVGYLNLLANCIDNFIHGLAVASSFLTSFKLGLTTVFAILIHEIPHEIGDFAILLNSGFSRVEAAKAQLMTASIGMTGACFALWMDAVDAKEANSLWVLPFSAGGFLNIALVSVLPDILKEKEPKEALIQLVFMLLGISTMAVLCIV